MPRNHSEKVPRVMVKRMVTPEGCDPMRLEIRTNGCGGHAVWIGCGGEEFYALFAKDELEAQQVYDWFEDDFLYVEMPGWSDEGHDGCGRWEVSYDAT